MGKDTLYTVKRITDGKFAEIRRISDGQLQALLIDIRARHPEVLRDFVGGGGEEDADQQQQQGSQGHLEFLTVWISWWPTRGDGRVPKSVTAPKSAPCQPTPSNQAALKRPW